MMDVTRNSEQSRAVACNTLKQALGDQWNAQDVLWAIDNMDTYEIVAMAEKQPWADIIFNDLRREYDDVVRPLVKRREQHSALSNSVAAAPVTPPTKTPCPCAECGIVTNDWYGSISEPLCDEHFLILANKVTAEELERIRSQMGVYRGMNESEAEVRRRYIRALVTINDHAMDGDSSTMKDVFNSLGKGGSATNDWD